MVSSSDPTLDDYVYNPKIDTGVLTRHEGDVATKVGSINLKWDSCVC